MLIGNLTRDPELRYTSKGTAVCSFGLATNRSWTTDQGEKKEDVSFHRIVAWSKLAEICSQLLFKGRRIYLEGRLQTRQWEDPNGNNRKITEIVLSEMLILDSRRQSENKDEEPNLKKTTPEIKKQEIKDDQKKTKKQPNQKKDNLEEKIDTSDIPF